MSRTRHVFSEHGKYVSDKPCHLILVDGDALNLAVSKDGNIPHRSPDATTHIQHLVPRLNLDGVCEGWKGWSGYMACILKGILSSTKTRIRSRQIRQKATEAWKQHTVPPDRGSNTKFVDQRGNLPAVSPGMHSFQYLLSASYDQKCLPGHVSSSQVLNCDHGSLHQRLCKESTRYN